MLRYNLTLRQVGMGGSLGVKEPLRKNEARKLIQRIQTSSGSIVLTRHAREALSDDSMEIGDALNVLRYGKIHRSPEFENGGWRYRVETERMALVIQFRFPSEIVVITSWRKSR
jgi:hypothetical protein